MTCFFPIFLNLKRSGEQVKAEKAVMSDDLSPEGFGPQGE
jgi:hypothetical protein